MNRILIFIVTLTLFPIVASAESAESFCAGIVKTYNKSLTDYCDDTDLTNHFSRCIRFYVDMKGRYEDLIGYGAEDMTVKRQFESCVSQKKREQGDSDFLKYLDRY